jgi:hypothetical protein
MTQIRNPTLFVVSELFVDNIIQVHYTPGISDSSEIKLVVLSFG